MWMAAAAMSSRLNLGFVQPGRSGSTRRGFEVLSEPIQRLCAHAVLAAILSACLSSLALIFSVAFFDDERPNSLADSGRGRSSFENHLPRRTAYCYYQSYYVRKIGTRYENMEPIMDEPMTTTGAASRLRARQTIR